MVPASTPSTRPDAGQRRGWSQTDESAGEAAIVDDWRDAFGEANDNVDVLKQTLATLQKEKREGQKKAVKGIRWLLNANEISH